MITGFACLIGTLVGAAAAAVYLSVWWLVRRKVRTVFFPGTCPRCGGTEFYRDFDEAQLAFVTNVFRTGKNLYCPAITYEPDGRICKQCGIPAVPIPE